MKLMAATILSVSLFGGGIASAQQFGADAAWRAPIVGTTKAVLESKMLCQNNKWYAHVRLTAPPAAPQQQGGFAPVLVPQAAVSPIRDGFVEISFDDFARASVVPPSGVHPGEMWLKIQHYRVYDSARGWRQGPNTMPIWLNWSVVAENGQLHLVSKADLANRTGFGELTNFVARVFNVSPATVECARPAPGQIPPLDRSAPQPRWRAHYGG